MTNRRQKPSQTLVIAQNPFSNLTVGRKQEAYCVKCKAKRNMKDAGEVTMANGRRAMKGKCPECGTGMFKILGKA
jgi:hypothetical protein